MTLEDLSPGVVERRLRDLSELHALGRSLATARLVGPDQAGEDERYANAMAAFHAGDYASAFSSILERARRGDAEAQCLVGNYFDLGLEGSTDRQQAEHWYLLAATQGYGVATSNLGTLCARRGDELGAMAWYALAREQGFSATPR